MTQSWSRPLGNVDLRNLCVCVEVIDDDGHKDDDDDIGRNPVLSAFPSFTYIHTLGPRHDTEKIVDPSDVCDQRTTAVSLTGSMPTFIIACTNLSENGPQNQEE